MTIVENSVGPQDHVTEPPLADQSLAPAVFTVYCTLHHVQCTLYSEQCTVYSEQCTVFDILFHCSVPIILFDISPWEGWTYCGTVR